AHRREGPGRVCILAEGTGQPVGNRDGVLDARERAEEDPELPVDRASVEDLDHELDVGRGEEPEVTGVVGELNGLADAGSSAAILPVDLDVKAAVADVEAEARVRAGRERGR